MNSELKPKIRFKGFTDDWEQRKLKEMTIYKNGTGHEDKQSPNGKYELINLNSVSIDGGLKSSGKYIDDANETLKENDLVMVLSDVGHGDLLGRVAIIPVNNRFVLNQRVALLRPNNTINPKFLFTCINSGQSYFKTNGAGSSQLNISKDVVEEFEPFIPQKEEQQRISTFFENIDNLITLHQRKCDKLVELKKSLLEKMFPQNNSVIPEIRFRGFNDDWEQRKLNNMCSIITKQTGFDYSATIKPSLVEHRIPNSYSFIQNKDFEGLNINLNTDFYIPKSVANQFPKITLDTPSLLISISGKIGNVGFYSLKNKAFIGGAVGICKLLNPDDGILSTYELESDYGQKYFQSLIKASSHANITVEDIRNIELILPKDGNERSNISKFLLDLDNLIILHQRKHDKLNKIKQSLLNDMFV